MKVLVDTSAWLALYDRNDQQHARAVALAESLKAQRALLVLSEFLLAESLTLIRYRVSHAVAVRFGQAILDSRVAEIASCDESLRRRAWSIFQRYADKDFSFVDCTSFAIMEQLKVPMAFAFDHHFEQYGLQLL